MSNLLLVNFHDSYFPMEDRSQEYSIIVGRKTIPTTEDPAKCIVKIEKNKKKENQ